MGQTEYLTAEEAARIADEYNNLNDVNLKKVLASVKSAAKKGDKVVNVDQDLLDKHTRGKLIRLGYRLGKKRSSQSDSVYFQAATQEVIFGNSEEENDD
jgi:transcription elongation GreA/GreB family factor